MGKKKAGSQCLRYSTYHSTTREKMVITPAYRRRITTLGPVLVLWKEFLNFSRSKSDKTLSMS